MQLSIQEIIYGTPDYQATLQLRDAVLRKPLGINFSAAQLAAEVEDFHLAVWAENLLVACLVLSPTNATTLKMRQVAVKPEWQGQGIGRQLVAYSEQWATQRGFRSMYCHARETAVPFYLQMGYRKVQGPFEEVTLPHYRMEKVLTA